MSEPRRPEPPPEPPVDPPVDPWVEQLLSDAAAEEAAVMREAAALEDAPGLDRVSAVLEREWDAPRRGRFRRPLAVAALLVALGAILFGVLGERTREEPFLLGSELELLSPAEVDRYAEIRWRGPAGASYAVRIVAGGAPGAPGDGPALHGPLEVREPRLALPAEAAGWPASIEVEVEATAGDGSELGRARWRIERRAP